MAKSKKRKLIAANKVTKHPDRPAKASKPAQRTEPTIPFSPEDCILLIGEGDFSFARSIVEHHGCSNIAATSLDSKDEVLKKYSPQASSHTEYLDSEGQTVLYNIDATKLAKAKSLNPGKGQRFDRIIFNFPHIGGKSTDQNRQVRANQELLVNFFTSALSLLSAEHGTIIVTLFEGEPYTLWNIRDLARHSGLEVERSFKFLSEAYPGYAHARTLGNIDGGGGWKGERRDARSFVLRIKGEWSVTARVVGTGDKRKRKRDADDDSSDED